MEKKSKTQLTGPYQLEPAVIWARQTIFAAFAATLAIFLLLPFSEVILRQYCRQLSLRRVDITKTFRPPPEQPLRQNKPRVEKKPPKPKLAKARKQLVPLQIAAGLMLDMGGGSGDFALNFGLTPVFAGQDLVFELSEVDQPPCPAAQVLPLYPITAKARGVQGKVELTFVVQADGLVGNIEVVSSSPGDIFTKAAVNAVKQWRFKPGTKGGKAVATRVLAPLRFRLED
ncbi:MAG: energy transducer TonB [Candidatus Omnitrophica bacterium]|nr:energy transducer TonB [Candidatus Omnitrophota bacterium]